VLATGAMHTVQPKNSFINHYYRKRVISSPKCNAKYIHSHKIEALLRVKGVKGLRVNLIHKGYRAGL